MKKQKSDLTFKKVVNVFFVVLAIIVVFAFFDYLMHQLSEQYSVPERYFRNKIIFGTLIGLVTYFFIEKLKPVSKALIFSAAVAVLLQIRYFLEGYPLNFVLLFLGIHFVILLIVSWIAFKLVKV